MPDTLTHPNFAESDRYPLAVRAFLGDSKTEARYLGGFSPETKKVYAQSVSEFFEWMEMSRGRSVDPADITSADAEAYVHHLANRADSGVRLARLRKNGRTSHREAICEAVRNIGEGSRRQVALALPLSLTRAHPSNSGDGVDLDWLAAELATLVAEHLLARSPTLDELRAQDTRAALHIGVDEHAVAVVDAEGRRVVALDDVFVYRIAPTRPLARSSIALRVAALSAFWESLIEPHDQNEPLLKYNVFSGVNRRVQRGLPAEKRLAAEEAGRLTADTIEKLLAATAGLSLTDKRNAALLWFLVLTGARVSEALALKRGLPPSAREKGLWPGWCDVDSDPPCVHMTRKGEKRARLPYPPAALQPLILFHAALRDKAQATKSQGPMKTLYEKLANEADAPLFPSVAFWGKNAAVSDYQRPMMRRSVSKLLQRLGKKAGLTADQLDALHPHAIRHFAATAMVRGGKDIREVQAILGHESMTTTERYIESERDPVALSGQTAVFAYLAKEREKRATGEDGRLVGVID